MRKKEIDSCLLIVKCGYITQLTNSYFFSLPLLLYRFAFHRVFLHFSSNYWYLNNKNILKDFNSAFSFLSDFSHSILNNLNTATIQCLFILLRYCKFSNFVCVLGTLLSIPIVTDSSRTQTIF